MFLTTAAALTATALTLSACETGPASPPVEQAVGLPLDAPRVSVESTGEGEKKVLSFADIGAEQNLTFTTRSDFSQTIPDKPTAATKAKDYATDNLAKDNGGDEVTLPLEGKVEEATQDVEGQAPATRNAFFTVRNPETTGDNNEAMPSADGFQVGWRGLDNGQMNSIRLAAPTEARDTARAEVEQALMKLPALPVVFPDEAVGKGASWSVDSRVTGDSTMLQTTTYTIKKMEGSVVELDVDIAQRPALGALSLEGRTDDPELAKQNLEVLDSASATTGSITVDTTKPLPTGGFVDVATAVVYGTKDSATNKSKENTDGGSNKVVQNFRSTINFG
ncbi:hypothetical protein H0194_01965 [Corynebacterium incognita]|uniref:Secreted protein n=1 Tax=Corynebacterium incognita TaxID=2754725 RepID=A0A7G7CQH4_9CORY|nr:hypothetical protein [Corynebacterium incognita]QNE89840.1 hypothetical protein H0194_01965 [Corynebacterium incognita]